MYRSKSQDLQAAGGLPQMEGFAAAAAAIQLAQCGIEIAAFLTGIRRKALEAPARFAQYHRQVDQVVITAKRIEQNPTLQIPEVHFYISETLREVRRVQHTIEKFSNSSHKRRYWKAITGNSERKVIESLERAHRTMSKLCLFVEVVSTERLNNLQGDVDYLVSQATERSSCAGAVVPYRKPPEKRRKRKAKARSTAKNALRRQTSSNRMSNTADTRVRLETGSHVVRGGTFIDCEWTTLGNTSSATTPDTPDAPCMEGHIYEDLKFERPIGLHIGNTGPGLQGHEIINPDVRDGKGVVIGDYSDLGVKGESFEKILNLVVHRN
ncbi:hypothetical protein DL766_003644 [Monosporascus sp. MC13-8B]|uniref:NACHT-NTPase and P-loop NTPases N-terminal domain-containing protein n=1 Tax=Monosporascus cannonballus TaxID=155416 RepID=A0ABY0H7H4_9PEZI|nr:hypothetical protein DL762_004929 [Monosporascus cannonballus]RYO91567.1 hypothetical protein DL763_004948 [Monosporascus cannonballus]RYP33144.1 hypothetical protein DL766_003644 [Monosporascus sp. MC13-8B]